MSVKVDNNPIIHFLVPVRIRIWKGLSSVMENKRLIFLLLKWWD